LRSPTSKIGIRMLSFGPEPLAEDWLTRRVEDALAAREAMAFRAREITGYREINSEGDGLPGLTVDRYGDDRVVILGTAAMVALHEQILAILRPSARTVYVVKPEASARWEGFAPGHATLGEARPLEYRAHGLDFEVPPPPAQKTGAFLDQRDNHPVLADLAVTRGAEVLDLGCHLGGFAAQAARRGLAAVAVDASEAALAGAKKTFARAALRPARFVQADMFGPLAEPALAGPFGAVVIDPPGLAARKRDVPRAAAALAHLVARVGHRLLPHGYLVLCSCSHHLDGRRLDQAVLDSGLACSRIATLGAGPDHPISMGHEEGEYLRVLVYQVRG
jgi:23S rRNA (cytosine1962-C5)-methyltransferase